MKKVFGYEIGGFWVWFWVDNAQKCGGKKRNDLNGLGVLRFAFGYYCSFYVIFKVNDVYINNALRIADLGALFLRIAQYQLLFGDNLTILPKNVLSTTFCVVFLRFS